MSSFTCEICGTTILDMPYKGYITFCEHYPPVKPKEPSKEVKDLMDIFGIK